jgi:hypothetical protein
MRASNTELERGAPAMPGEKEVARLAGVRLSPARQPKLKGNLKNL